MASFYTFLMENLAEDPFAEELVRMIQSDEEFPVCEDEEATDLQADDIADYLVKKDLSCVSVEQFCNCWDRFCKKAAECGEPVRMVKAERVDNIRKEITAKIKCGIYGLKSASTLPQGIREPYTEEEREHLYNFITSMSQSFFIQFLDDCRFSGCFEFMMVLDYIYDWRYYGEAEDETEEAQDIMEEELCTEFTPGVIFGLLAQNPVYSDLGKRFLQRYALSGSMYDISESSK